MVPNPGRPGCALVLGDPSLPRLSLSTWLQPGSLRSGNGISPPSRALEGAVSAGLAASPLPRVFLGIQVFSPPSLPLFKLPFENTFCFFPAAPAKLLSTKGVTKRRLR